jgi:hypothetical protein
VEVGFVILIVISVGYYLDMFELSIFEPEGFKKSICLLFLPFPEQLPFSSTTFRGSPVSKVIILRDSHTLGNTLYDFILSILSSATRTSVFDPQKPQICESGFTSIKEHNVLGSESKQVGFFFFWIV